MVAVDGPCTAWTTSEAVAQGPCAPDDGRFDEELLVECATIASGWLFRLSGRRYPGACQVTVRPLWGEACGSYSRAVLADSWGLFDSRTGTLRRPGVPWGHRGETPFEITLGYYPIREILGVVIDGVALDPSAYRVDDRRWLLRKDGQLWPLVQDLTKEPGDPDTWTVTFTFGEDVPPDGQLAARVLACELAQGLTTGVCRLPKRATNLARQGVNIALIDPVDVLDQGKFGIPEVDAFLHTVNPARLTERPSIMSVDVRRPVRPSGLPTVPDSS